jgi:hypothetical protein
VAAINAAVPANIALPEGRNPDRPPDNHLDATRLRADTAPRRPVELVAEAIAQCHLAKVDHSGRTEGFGVAFWSARRGCLGSAGCSAIMVWRLVDRSLVSSPT